MKKQHCPHPKNKIYSEMDSNGVYRENCIKCGTKLVTRKYPKAAGK